MFVYKIIQIAIKLNVKINSFQGSWIAIPFNLDI